VRAGLMRSRQRAATADLSRIWATARRDFDCWPLSF